jgi:cell division initiation protein
VLPTHDRLVAGREDAVRLTPLDIQNHRFQSRLRGLDPVEVESFLQLLSEDYESLLRERDGLEEKVHRLEARVADLAANELALQRTLVSAQTLSEDMKKTATREAEVLLSEAEVKAEKVLAASHRRAAKLAEDIREMKMLRTRLGATLRQTIETHLALIDTLTAVDEEEAGQDKVAYLAGQREGSA